MRNTSTNNETSMRRAIAGAVVGTSLEWYDFFLYGAAAAIVFGEVFFPSYDPLTGTLLSFLTFSVGFIARPVGAAIAGHYGDRVGRKIVLLVTIGLMGASTTLIGLLPGYNTIGVAAPILLTLIRMVQGLALGGEWAGGALMIAERAPRGRRGFLTSFIQVGASIGNLLSTGLLLLMSTMLTQSQFISWGWRVPFLFSAVVVFVGLYIRFRVNESPAFEALKEQNEVSQSPVREVFKEQWRDILRIVGIRAGADIVFYLLVTFLLTYIVEELGLPRSVGLAAALIGASTQLITYPSTGALSDRLGRRRLTVFGALGAMFWMAVFFFPLVNTRSTGFIIVAVLGGLLFHAAMYGPQAAWICEIFEAKHRYSGAALGYQLAGIVGGSLAPTIAVGLLAATRSTWAISVYACVALAISAGAAMITRETVDARDLIPDFQGDRAGDLSSVPRG